MRDDGGAVAVLVAILLAAGVLTGLLAITVDVGRVYAERRIVQNGADSASLALAQKCAEGDPNVSGEPCDTQALALSAAEARANADAPDGATGVTEVCGTTPLAGCVPREATWTECKSVDGAKFKHFVRVHTQTQEANGDSFLVPYFAHLLSGGSDEVPVAACSQTAWGPAASAIINLAILLPVCPGVPGDDIARVIEDFDPNDPDDPNCTVEGVAYPGVTKGFAFGQLPGQTKECTDPVEVSVGDIIPIETSVTQWCGNKLEDSLGTLLGQKLIVPVVGAHTKTGQGQYDFSVLSFKYFTFMGYKIKNQSGGDEPTGGWNSTVCGHGAKRSCLYGEFSSTVVSGDVGGGPDLGVRAIQLIP